MNWLKWVQYLAYYLSFLLLPMLIWMVTMVVQQPDLVYWWMGLVFTLWFFYMRFVEPYKIVIRREQVGKRLDDSHLKYPDGVKIALLTDLHLGIFKGERFLKRVLARLKKDKPDLIILGGDLINDPTDKYLRRMFVDLKSLDVPIVAVTGNHDAGIPGDYESVRVRRELEKVGVQTIDNGFRSIKLGKNSLKIFGLSDFSEGRFDLDVLTGMKRGDFNILIAHNPDMAYYIEKKYPVDLILSGHTHAGQIYLPPLSNWLIPCKYKFVRGWYKVKGKAVYVSSGMGEVVLPMRFLIPPEIVMLEF
ncbi:metallophosphoesterase [Candidatus Peregrinibacteria bacterium]|nr:metallophosphoesterase [Candidatus Peregrinibacteria bacterium]